MSFLTELLSFFKNGDTSDEQYYREIASLLDVIYDKFLGIGDNITFSSIDVSNKQYNFETFRTDSDLEVYLGAHYLDTHITAKMGERLLKLYRMVKKDRYLLFLDKDCAIVFTKGFNYPIIKFNINGNLLIINFENNPIFSVTVKNKNLDGIISITEDFKNEIFNDRKIFSTLKHFYFINDDMCYSSKKIYFNNISDSFYLKNNVYYGWNNVIDDESLPLFIINDLSYYKDNYHKFSTSDIFIKNSDDTYNKIVFIDDNYKIIGTFSYSKLISYFNNLNIDITHSDLFISCANHKLGEIGLTTSMKHKIKKYCTENK